MNWVEQLPHGADNSLPGLCDIRRAYLKLRWRAPLRHGDEVIAPQALLPFRMADAAIYCAFGASNFTADIGAFCKASGRLFVLLLGSDLDLQDFYEKGSAVKNAYGATGGECFNAIQRADLIVAQTEAQRSRLHSVFGRASVVVRNPIALDLPPRRKPRQAGQFAIWIGKSDRVKCPHLLFELARLVPDLAIKAIINRTNAEIYGELVAARPPNVEIIERLAYDDLDELIGDAYVLINTSPAEGMPNTYLQAARRGVPVASLAVDPDGFIQRESAGVAAGGDVTRLAEQVRALFESPQRRNEMGRNARTYVERNHALGPCVDRLEGALLHLIETRAQAVPERQPT